MKALIHFAYTGTYWDRGGNEPSAQPRLIVNAKVYALAEEYQCPTLKQYAIAQFKDATADHDDVLDVEAMIRLVYTTTPADDQGLREQLIRTVMRDYRWWRAREGFQQALETMPRFCQSVLSRLEHKATLPPDALNDASTCPTCHTADYEMYHGQIVHPCKSCHQMINRRWF